jgi:metal-sulfur cluster biosynthetic enzyme
MSEIREGATVDVDDLRNRVIAKMSQVIDPETGVNVIRMRLIEELKIREDGFVSYKFRPSSPLCPLAVSLSVQIKKAVAEVEGVTGQKITVVGYVGADDLNQLLREQV